MKTLADQVAVAIENARLYEETRRRATQAALIYEAGQRVTGELELDALLEVIVSSLREAFDYHNVMLMMLDEEAQRLILQDIAGAYADDFSPGLSLALGEGMIGYAAASGETQVSGDVSRDPHYVRKAEEDTRSELAVPIESGRKVIGVLDLQDDEFDAFGEIDVTAMETLSTQIATAIENARLHRRVLDYAETLEQRVQERTVELQAQYARLDAILDSTADGLIVTDQEGEITRANPVAGAWFTETLSPEEAERLREGVQELAQRAEERPKAVLELTGLDLELSAAPISRPALRGAAAVVAAHDVSKLKALNRMKTRFITNISHELRTPIASIKLYVHLMKTQPERWREYLEALGREAEHQIQLVEGILEIARIDAGRLEMKPRPTNLNELTERAVLNQWGTAQEHGLTLEHHPAEPAPVARADPQQMMQVLDNLMSNAILYTPEGGRVTVSTGKEEAKGRVWATLTVADSGMGIPEEELPHIFDRFFRGVEPRSMQVSGTGLGLSIVQEIVGQHGGRVTVESPSTTLRTGEVGEGSTFTVWLPLAAARGQGLGARD